MTHRRGASRSSTSVSGVPRDYSLFLPQIFALEFPQVNVLNYSPGPVDTEMFDTLIKKSSAPDLRAQFGELREQRNILTAEQSVDRLVMVLKDQKYKPGEHVDYYDQL